MPDIDLTADCSRCAALCCIVLPFDQSLAFGFDKAADEPCRHLAPDNRCSIHAHLADGFSGCVQFDCHGAGQRVTQEVFAGRSWRDDPALTGPMGAAFHTMRKLHEAVLLLNMAARLPLAAPQDRARCALLERLDPQRNRNHAELSAFLTDPVWNDVRGFLAGLREVAKIRQRRR